MRAAVAVVLVLAASSVASADPPKAALGVPVGSAEATIRVAWRSWITSATWAEVSGPNAAIVSACVAADATCANGVAALRADRTWIVSLGAPATPGAEPFVVGRVYDGAGALITSSQRVCVRCATNRATLTAEVGKLLDGLRDAADRLTTRLIVERDGDGPQVFVDGAGFEPTAAGQPITPGAHTITIAGECWDMAPLSVIVSSGETVRARLTATRRAPRLRIRTRPGGVAIGVDGAAIGVTTDAGLEIASAAGPHRVTATKAGWQAASHELALAGCETRDVDVVLLHRAPRGPARWYAAIGGGVAIAAGLTLLIVDREQVIDGNRSATYRDSGPLGAVVTGVGVAAVGVAVYLWRREPPLIPAIAPTKGGAVGTAAWRF